MSNNNNCCPICLEAIVSDELKTECQHQFHYQCLRKCAAMPPATRFFPVGLFPKDPLPLIKCPVCRQPITKYYWPGKTLQQVHYRYDSSGPYGLQPGALVYYYQQLRQPGSARAGSIGVLQKIGGPMTIVRSIWPELDTLHEVRPYLVFDILFLALPGSIPTRSQVNQYFVADNLGQGFVTETIVAGSFPSPRELSHIKKLLLEHRNPSHLAPELKSATFFCDVYLANALNPLTAGQKWQVSRPDMSLSLQPYYERLQKLGIGLNQARVIWAYYKWHGLLADEEGDAEKVLKLLRLAQA